MATSEISTHIFGQKSVTTAGTAEALETTNFRLTKLVITAHAANTGQVYYGGSDVDSSTQAGLDAGESVTLENDRVFNIADVFIDVDTNGEGADFVGTLR